MRDLAQSYIEIGNYVKAIHYYVMAIEEEYELLIVMNDFLTVCEKIMDGKNAEKEFYKVFEQSNVSLLCNLALHCKKYYRYDFAINCFELAIVKGWECNKYSVMDFCCYKISNYEKAVKYFELAFDKGYKYNKYFIVGYCCYAMHGYEKL